MMEPVELIKPRIEYIAEFLAMAEECHAIGEMRFDALYEEARADSGAFMHRLGEKERGIKLAPGIVPESMFWLMRADHLLGVSFLRHTLTPRLEQVGGHIGYFIRPSERQKGYGTRILALVLGHARELGLKRVLLTCDTDNTASARIIQKNGGILASAGFSDLTGKSVSLYWIDLETPTTSGRDVL